MASTVSLALLSKKLSIILFCTILLATQSKIVEAFSNKKQSSIFPFTTTTPISSHRIKTTKPFNYDWRSLQVEKSNRCLAILFYGNERFFHDSSENSGSDELGHDDDDDDEDDEEEDLDDAGNIESDWIQAELTLINAPKEPHPDLDAYQVATIICRSLQFVDYPTNDAGLQRCFPFFTHDCRAVVTARQGAKTMERFVEYGRLAPALQPFMGATRVIIGGIDGRNNDAVTFTDAKPPLRGAIASFPIIIQGAPILSLNHLSGMQRSGIAAGPPITNMVLRLECQRRPPNQNCWMVREILDVRHAFAGDMGNAHVGG